MANRKRNAPNKNKKDKDVDEVHWQAAWSVQEINPNKHDYFIILRRNQKIENVVKVVNTSYGIGLSFQNEQHPKFQVYVREALSKADTVIHTIGEEPPKRDTVLSRTYSPTHPDAYESANLVRDVTGKIL